MIFAKTRNLFDRCLEEGIRNGLKRARKHNDSPTDSVIAEAIFDAVILEVDHYFGFVDPDPGSAEDYLNYVISKKEDLNS